MSVPERVGSYRIVGTLGRGGFAVVYAAEDERDGTPAAVKIPDVGSGPVRGAWLRREASLAARLRHPNIVQLLAAGSVEVDGATVPYLVFERIHGPTLEKMADRLGVAAIVSVGAQLLDALGYAHDAGVVHCDIKPENVLVSGEDARGLPVVRLLDFGLAATRVPGAQEQTGLPLVAGTPGYLSPEQARGAGRLTPQSDIYSLGALLYRLVAGFPPHFGSSTTEVMRRTLRVAPPPVRPRPGLEVPENLLALIDRMLSQEPPRRPASAYRARRALLEAASAAELIDGDEAFDTADTIPPEPVVGHPTVPDPTSAAETIAASSVREPLATPAVAISRHVGRRAPLCGRDREVAALEEACTREPADRDERPITVIVGPLGTGRTRLLREVISRSRSRGMSIHGVSSRRGVRSPPFEVLAGLALDVIGAAGTSPPWLAAERLSEALTAAGVPDDDAGRDALVGGLVGVGLPTAVGRVRPSAYRAFLALLGEERDPALLTVDDADSIDEDSLAVLETLARAPDTRDGRGAPRVVLTAAECPDPVDEAAVYEKVRIGPLDLASSTRVLAALTDRVPDSLEDAARAALGVPADLTEAAAAVLSAEASDRLPLLERRVRSLPERVGAVLSAAAIFEGDAPVRALPSVAAAVSADLDSQTARASFDRLVLDGLLVRPSNPAATIEPVAHFASERVRHLVVSRLDDASRRAMCRAAARWLVRESHDASPGMQAVLAAHAEAGGDLATAAWAYATAGRIGAATGRPEASADLAMALTLARSADEPIESVDEPGLLGELATLANERGEAETAELFALQALQLAEQERTTLRARLHRVIAEANTQRRSVDAALANADRALELLGDDGDPVELASALALEGWLLGYLCGRNDEGIALGLRARDVASRIDAPAFRASLCGRLGANFLRAGDWDGQLATNLEDLGLSARARDIGGVTRANINLGVCFINRGMPALARAFTERAIDLSRRYGHRSPYQIALNNLAMIAVDEHRIDDAERAAREVVEHAERSALRAGLGETWVTLARVALWRGEHEEAERALERADEGADGAVDRELVARVRCALWVARGRPDRALETLEPWVEGPEPDPYERANSRLTYAAALRAAGRSADAEAQEALARTVHERLGADADHERRRWQRLTPGR